MGTKRFTLISALVISLSLVLTACGGGGSSAKDWYQDVDGDGYTDGITESAGSQPEGVIDVTELISTEELDCDDADGAAYPGATEVLSDGIDQDCDGSDLLCPEVTFLELFGGTTREFGYSVQQTTDGGYILAGSTTSYGSGSDDMYLVKTDSSGKETWSKTFGGSNNDIGYSVQQTQDGGYVITGSTASGGAGYGEVLLIKTDAYGNVY